MKRREFITLVECGGDMASCCKCCRKTPIIGLLGVPIQFIDVAKNMDRGVRGGHRLRELGWIEGSTVKIEARWRKDG